MTTMPERTATLTSLVAAEIRAQMGRLDVRQSELARRMGENDQWVSTRLKGRTPIDLNDLHRFARALDVEVYELLPSREQAARAAMPSGIRRSVNVPWRTGSRSADVSPVASPAYGPFGGGRHDSVRPVSAVPGTRTRPRRLR